MSTSDITQRPKIDARHARGRVTRRSSDRDRINARWLAGFAALGGAVAGCEPTGFLPADVALSAAFAAIVTLSASRARRWSWVVLGAATFAFAGGYWEWRVVGLACLVLAVGSVVLEERSRALGALIGGLSIQVLLRLPDMGFHGFTALVVPLILLPVFITGYQRARSEEQPIIRWVIGATIGIVFLITVAYGAAAVLARTHLENGLDSARAGLDAAREGNDEQAEALLVEGANAFGSADSLLNGPLALPARVVPVLGLQAKASGDIAASGHDLLSAAAETASVVNYEALRPTSGRVDLASLYNAVIPLENSLLALERADDALAGAASPWLAPPIADALAEFDDEVDSTLPEARLASGAVDAAPLLLGATGPQRYLVLFGQPAESRFGGGFVGTWAELTANAGEVDLVESGTIEDLKNAPGATERTLTGPDQYLERYERYFPAYNLQNVDASPHFPHVRQVISELYPQAGGKPLSGAIYVDPEGVAALLELTGPVDVEGLPEPLTAETAAQFLTTDIYAQFPDSAERDAVLQNAIEAVFDALTSRDLPGPRAIADALAPATEGNHLSLSVSDDRPEDFLVSAGINGAFTAVPDNGDLVSLRTANSAPNKLDTYLQRSLRYDVDVDPGHGTIAATATVTLTNTAPASGLPAEVGTNRGIVEGDPDAPPPGTAIQYVSLYSPLKLRSATTAGEAASIEQQTELQRNVYSQHVRIAPGESITLTFELTGTFRGDEYTLIVDHQPTARDDDVEVIINGAAGWAPTDLENLEENDDGALVYAGAPQRDVQVSARWAPD